jgi:hypothetical protein
MKNSVLKLSLAVILCLPLAAPARAGQETAESVAKAYFAAMQAGDWAKCAGLMHPEALASMKRTFGSVIGVDKSGGAAKAIFGLKSNAEFGQLRDAEVYERLMNFIVQSVPDMKTALANSTATILGQVSEGGELVHVVYRMQFKMQGADVGEVELISFKKDGANWRALLTSDMEEMIGKMAQSLAAGQGDNQPPASGAKPKRNN